MNFHADFDILDSVVISPVDTTFVYETGPKADKYYYEVYLDYGSVPFFCLRGVPNFSIIYSEVEASIGRTRNTINASKPKILYWSVKNGQI